jgi:protein-L-isoaspartate(D-aspartate) O-methyltransferase
MSVADFALARHSMVTEHLRPNGISDPRLLAAMQDVPREFFVAPAWAPLATLDRDIPVGAGRFLLEPLVLARLIEAATLGPQSCVLDIAPATGYSTVLLSALAGHVTALEEDPTLVATMHTNLSRSHVVNASIVQGPLSAGWSQGAPYDAILVNGGIENVPLAFHHQLAEGGCLVAIILKKTAFTTVGEARRYEKHQGALSFRPLFEAFVPELPGFTVPTPFVL